MNRVQFINSILKYLKKVPAEERDEVERYYNEMFDEAGIGTDDVIPESFGNPREIALNILTGIEEDVDPSIFENGATNDYVEKEKRRSNSLLIIILAIIAAPIGLPLAFAGAATLFALLISFVAVVFALGMLSVGIIMGLFVSTIPLITKLFGIGVVLVSVGLIILTFELLRFIIIKISDFISRKLRERRIRNEKKY